MRWPGTSQDGSAVGPLFGHHTDAVCCTVLEGVLSVVRGSIYLATNSILFLDNSRPDLRTLMVFLI